jgi:hypothetical protein
MAARICGRYERLLLGCSPALISTTRSVPVVCRYNGWLSMGKLALNIANKTLYLVPDKDGYLEVPPNITRVRNLDSSCLVEELMLEVVIN